MIQPQTYLNVADNSGARELMCIRIIGASNRRYAYIGDIVVAVIKKAVPNSSLERSEVIRAVIVRTCKELKRSNGIIIKYDDNAAVLIDKEGNRRKVFPYINEWGDHRTVEFKIMDVEEPQKLNVNVKIEPEELPFY